MRSRYDNLDRNTTKWELIQIRVSPDLKDRIKVACRLNDTDVSELTRSFWKAWLVSEQQDPQPAPVFNRFDWALERVRKFFRPERQYRFSRN